MDKRKQTKRSNKQLNDEKLIHELDLTIEPAMSRSRLKSHAKRNLILFALTAVILLIFLAFFGIQLLINFSLFLGNVRGSSENEPEDTTQEEVYIPQPLIRQGEKATKEPQVTIAGSALNAKTVELFVNDKHVDSTAVSDEKFSFTDVPLKDGENYIKTRSVNGKTSSDYSEAIRVVYREKAPDLEVETPREGDKFSGGVSTLKVKGRTAPYATVTINGARVVVDGEGVFRRDYRMQSGENKLLFVATDEAGNKTEKEIPFTYSP